jgi:hypothetical protein
MTVNFEIHTLTATNQCSFSILLNFVLDLHETLQDNYQKENLCNCYCYQGNEKQTVRSENKFLHVYKNSVH